MTTDKLIQEYYNHNPDGHFFDPKTLKFFGECRSKMYVYKDPEEITDCSGKKHTCWRLKSIGKGFLGERRVSYHFFDIHTFKDIIRA